MSSIGLSLEHLFRDSGTVQRLLHFRRWYLDEWSTSSHHWRFYNMGSQSCSLFPRSTWNLISLLLTSLLLPLPCLARHDWLHLFWNCKLIFFSKMFLVMVFYDSKKSNQDRMVLRCICGLDIKCARKNTEQSTPLAKVFWTRSLIP